MVLSFFKNTLSTHSALKCVKIKILTSYKENYKKDIHYKINKISLIEQLFGSCASPSKSPTELIEKINFKSTLLFGWNFECFIITICLLFHGNKF